VRRFYQRRGLSQCNSGRFPTHLLEGQQELTVKLSAVLLSFVFLIGCGGTAVSPPASSNAVAPPNNGNGGGSPATANSVTVAAGQTATGVDIAVFAPASSPAPNAQNLGVAPLTGTGTATNTGDVIHRGQTARVLLFGPGLTGDMQVTIRGSADIAISNVHSITSTDTTPGIAFNAVVTPDAALGARTVVLQNAKGDITTFTGGLEVVP